jgi:hypothetical protein
MQDSRKRSNPENHLKLPVGKVLSDPIKGDFYYLPLLGWIGVRETTETPLVMVTTTIFKSLEEPYPQGTLILEWPVFEDTELAVLAALESLGWDGRIWPRDSGWPEGNDEVDEENLREFLKQAKLAHTLVFPIQEGGAVAGKVSIQRARGPFLMPSLPQPTGSPNPERLAALRALCKDPTVFYSLALNPNLN